METDIAGMLEISDKKFKTMTDILRFLMDDIDSMQEQMSKISREKEILRKNQKEILEISYSVKNEECL